MVVAAVCWLLSVYYVVVATHVFYGACVSIAMIGDLLEIGPESLCSHPSETSECMTRQLEMKLEPYV